MKCLLSIMVLMPCVVSAAEFSVAQRNGKYCFQRPDGRVVMLLGMSHASAGPPVVGLETTIKDLRDFEKEKLISEDELKKAEDELQKLTDRFIQEIEYIGQRKEREIMEV